MCKFFFNLFFLFFFLHTVCSYAVEHEGNVIKGKLSNGLTWYIKSNAVPANKVHFRLIVNAGSTSESDTQQGLAHFLEHMAFKGSASFPPGTLIKQLESAGVKLGRDLNARTLTDETIYYLTIASDKCELGLQVLQDWAGNLLLDSAMIEQERGVILEELRLGRGVQTRLREQYYPVLFGQSVYSRRFVIGKEEVISAFPHKELKKFYSDCYRPERLAVVVIGDIDTVAMRKEIEARFGSLPVGPEPVLLPDVSVLQHNDLKVAVITDPEATGSVVQLFYKHPPLELKKQSDLKRNICHSLFSSILNMRLAEITEAGNAPFTYAESGYSSFNRGCDVYSNFAEALPGQELEALRTLLAEDRRVAVHGVTAAELKRAKRKVFARYERRYADRDKIPSSGLADECQVDFLHSEPLTGITAEYQLVQSILPEIGIRDINSLCGEYFTDSNRVIVISGPEKEGLVYPSDNEIRRMTDEMGSAMPEPYRDENLPEELISRLPAAGEIIKERKNKTTGITEWQLSNGARVMLKPTDFNNTVIFKAAGDGGYSVFPDSYDLSAKFATDIQDKSGVAGMSISRLRKILSGCNISVSQTIELYEQSMSGYFPVSDMKEFFQLLYLYHTSPYFDSIAFQRFISAQQARNAVKDEEPERYFSTQTDSVLNVANPRMNIKPTDDNLSDVSLDKINEVYSKLFGDPQGMNYVFAGNFTIEQIKSFVLTYIGGIPAGEQRKHPSVPQKMSYPDGPSEHIFYKGLENKVSVEMKFIKKADWNEKGSYCFNIFTELLSSRLFKALREDMGGVYGVHLTDRINNGHDRYAFFSMEFGTNTVIWKAVCQRALAETKRLIAEGPTQEELDRVKEKRKQSFVSNMHDNRAWASRMLDAACHGGKVENFINRRELIENLTVEDVLSAAKHYLDVDSVLTFTLLPESKK